MPSLRFRWGYDPATGLLPRHQCQLACEQCIGRTQTGARCRRSTCAHLPYCPQHLKTALSLEIRDAPGRGKGLFVVAPRDPLHPQIVFGPNERTHGRGKWIASLEGLELTDGQLAARYGASLAPYSVRIRAGVVHDGACHRSVGQYANTAVQAGNPRRIARGACNARFSLRQYDMYGNRHARADVPWLEATRIIREGDEIVADYGDGYLNGQTFAELEPHQTIRR